ncbi:MAG: hypothetical protein K0U36_04280 [Alphaproteobacteria bacterium]|nr:hypothetical protein [Alphaproteobacteria bacterium]
MKLIVLAALISSAGHVLLTQRRQHESFSGLWGFPGGKVVLGGNGGDRPRGGGTPSAEGAWAASERIGGALPLAESPVHALQRELYEELGITTDQACFAPITFATAGNGSFPTGYQPGEMPRRHHGNEGVAHQDGGGNRGDRLERTSHISGGNHRNGDRDDNDNGNVSTSNSNGDRNDNSDNNSDKNESSPLRLMLLYGCRVWEGDPYGKEGQPIKWVARNQLNQVAMPAANAPLLAMLREFM